MQSVFVILAVFGAFLIVPEVSGIREGVEVEKHSIPYQVRLQPYVVRKTTPCTGILISQRYVLTAANCLRNTTTSVEVTLGTHNWRETEEGEVKLTSTSWLIHEEFDKIIAKQPRNNIALILLPSAVELTDNIAVATLSSVSTDSLLGVTGRISGWGDYGTSVAHSGNDVLLAANATVVSGSDCAASYTNFDDSDICLAAGKRTYGVICLGDTGGPFVVDGAVVGVSSYSDDSCSPNYPSVVTSIADKYSWIVENSDI